MSKIFEAGDLPEGEKIYLKKDFLGWRIVHPIRDESTKKINYFNLIFGGKRNLVILILILLASGILYLGLTERISNCKLVEESPCTFCESCFEQTRSVINSLNRNKYAPINFSLITSNVSPSEAAS